MSVLVNEAVGRVVSFAEFVKLGDDERSRAGDSHEIAAGVSGAETSDLQLAVVDDRGFEAEHLARRGA